MTVAREPLKGREAYRVWRAVSTRWSDNDAYGHANNVVYYEWFDTAVNAWLVDRGLLDIAHGDPIALVVETRCTYWAPLAFPADVEVGLAIEHAAECGIIGHGGGHVVAEHLGQDERVGQAVRHVEMRADRPTHAVD